MMKTAITLLAAGLLACSGDAGTNPSPDVAQDLHVGQNTQAQSTDTTSSIGYTGVVHLQGRVLGVTRAASGGADSLDAAPVAGATLKLYHNVLVAGVATSVYVGETTSAADGSYEFRNVPAGYYLLRTNVASGRWAADVLSYVTAAAAAVTEDVRIWPKS